MNPVRLIFSYGIFLILCGVAGFLSNPEKAKTALISGGLFGGLSITWAYLLKRGEAWALHVARVMAILLSLIFAWRSFLSWMAVASGSGYKVVAAVLITLMLTGTLALLLLLWRLEKKSPTPK